MTAKAPESQGSVTRSPAGEAARLSASEIFGMIQESAYYKAEARGFSPGYEEQDWLEAEREVRARLGMSDRPRA